VSHLACPHSPLHRQPPSPDLHLPLALYLFLNLSLLLPAPPAACACCSGSTELLSSVRRLASRTPPLRHIIVECSGMSDVSTCTPHSIIQYSAVQCSAVSTLHYSFRLPECSGPATLAPPPTPTGSYPSPRSPLCLTLPLSPPLLPLPVPQPAGIVSTFQTSFPGPAGATTLAAEHSAPGPQPFLSSVVSRPRHPQGTPSLVALIPVVSLPLSLSPLALPLSLSPSRSPPTARTRWLQHWGDVHMQYSSNVELISSSGVLVVFPFR